MGLLPVSGKLKKQPVFIVELCPVISFAYQLLDFRRIKIIVLQKFNRFMELLFYF